MATSKSSMAPRLCRYLGPGSFCAAQCRPLPVAAGAAEDCASHTCLVDRQLVAYDAPTRLSPAPILCLLPPPPSTQQASQMLVCQQSRVLCVYSMSRIYLNPQTAADLRCTVPSIEMMSLFRLMPVNTVNIRLSAVGRVPFLF